MQRPDLSGLPDEVIAYIEHIEAELAHLQAAESAGERSEALAEASEPPTTVQVISISGNGVAKRTPRHLYGRQRRGGMGVFDLDSPEEDAPGFVVMADVTASLIILTNQGRTFRLPVLELPEREVRARGEPIAVRLGLRPGETPAVVVPDPPLQGGAFLILVTERGQVRRIARQYLGGSLQPGTVLYDIKEGGAPAAATWSTGTDDLFIVTRTGQAIRFAERLVPVRGCLGLRVDPADKIKAVVATSEEGGVFMQAADGKGTIREMRGFAANKSPGAGGKVAMKAEEIVGAVAVTDHSDLFVISRLGKIIRFQAIEVPAKEGVVQGVNCMALRADECTAVTAVAL
ncbi:MAG: hypothetical protein IPK16_04700 [Anaerolineales bacterium]|nr:hypothetical protein [Anaerolineales bacterium]